eukprot:8837267-Alexandrium_andersonii.AAC.1
MAEQLAKDDCMLSACTIMHHSRCDKQRSMATIRGTLARLEQVICLKQRLLARALLARVSHGKKNWINKWLERVTLSLIHISEPTRLALI